MLASEKARAPREPLGAVSIVEPPAGYPTRPKSAKLRIFAMRCNLTLSILFQRRKRQSNKFVRKDALDFKNEFG